MVKKSLFFLDIALTPVKKIVCVHNTIIKIHNTDKQIQE